MKAVGVVNYLPVGDSDAFIDFETEKPEPADRDVLVAVKAVAVNPVDVKVGAGRGKENVVEDPPRIIGWDASGVVEAAEIDAGRIRTTVSEVISPINADNLREAHRRVETGQARGKIVVDGFAGPA